MFDTGKMIEGCIEEKRKRDVAHSKLNDRVMKPVICSGLTRHWACEECAHGVEHEIQRLDDGQSCGKWERCDNLDIKVRCTKVS